MNLTFARSNTREYQARRAELERDAAVLWDRFAESSSHRDRWHLRAFAIECRTIATEATRLAEFTTLPDDVFESTKGRP